MPAALTEVVRNGRLAYSKARALAEVKDEALRSKLLERAVTDGLSLKELKHEVLPSPARPLGQRWDARVPPQRL